MAVAVVLLAIAVGVLTLLVFGLLRTHAEILRALDRAGISLDDDGSVAHQPVGPVPIDSPSRPPGRGAHDVVGTVPAGGPTKVSVTGVNHLTLLAFLSSGCRTCQGFWDAFADPDLQLPGGDTRLVIVGQDPIYDSESALAALVPNGIKTVLSTAAWQEYDVPGSPYFALVDGASNRVIGAGSATSWQQVRSLLQQALEDEGLAGKRASGARRGRNAGPQRERRVDEALLSAGIGPGHPSLYPEPAGSDGGDIASPAVDS